MVLVHSLKVGNRPILLAKTCLSRPECMPRTVFIIDDRPILMASVFLTLSETNIKMGWINSEICLTFSVAVVLLHATVRPSRSFSSPSLRSFRKSQNSRLSKVVFNYALNASSCSTRLYNPEIAGFLSLSKAFQAINSMLYTRVSRLTSS